MILKSMLAAAASLLLVVSAAAAPAKPAPAAWPQANSDIRADPQVRFGVLANGMRYAIQKNATPTGQAALRLRFDAGSLMETDAEQGIAHFIEHMAFNGSKKVPEGEMVKILERHGLAFGADTNAQTSWDQTVFQLDLPHTDEDTLDTGLMLMREVSSELLLAPAAIDREKGVVLSEERARDTPGLRVFKEGFSFFLKGQLAPTRVPIGKVEVISKADQPLIGGFYHRWYRPDRAVLIAVGDFDVDAVEAKIKALFSDWAAPAPEPGAPDLGTPGKRGLEAHVMVEPGSQLTIQTEWLQPADLSSDSRAKRRRKLIEQLGLSVLNRRLERLARTANPPFIAAQASKDDVFRSAEVTTYTLLPRPGDWQGSLAVAEQEQRRIVQYGVRQDELDREIKEYRVAYQAAVQGAATRKTTRIADSIASSVDDREVYTDPAEDLALFEDGLKGVDAKVVSQALKQVFTGSGPLVFMASPTAVDGGDGALLAAYRASMAKPVSATVAETAKTWPYTSFGPAGTVAERKELTDLGATMVRFRNGAQLTIKPTKFRDNQILVRVRVGHGISGLPRDRVTEAWARSGFIEGGLKQLTAEEVEQILASNIYGAEFHAQDDAFVLEGTTRPEDLKLQLQVLTAYLTQPGFRPEAFQRIKTYTATLLDQLTATPGNVLRRDLSWLMHSKDPRYAFPNAADIAQATPEAFRSVIQSGLESGDLEVVVVGDTTPDKVIELVGQTLGALPPRTPSTLPADQLKTAMPGAVSEPVVLRHKGRADQAVAYAAWPSTDFFADPQQARTLRVLAQVIELRLIEDLRETAGDTYSPQASANASLTYPGYGYLQAEVEIPPAKLDDFSRDLEKISADLRSKDVSADELERAKKPLIDSLMKSRQTNDYWLEQLSGAQADSRKLEAVRGVVESLQKVDAAQLRQAAQTYLQDGKLWKLEVLPEEKGAASSAAPSDPGAPRP